MSRYFTKRPSQRLYVEDETFGSESPFVASVSVPDHIATDTGLLDASGDVIWRACRPIGFGRDSEW